MFDLLKYCVQIVKYKDELKISINVNIKRAFIACLKLDVLNGVHCEA